jgi:hypothetical protein
LRRCNQAADYQEVTLTVQVDGLLLANINLVVLHQSRRKEKALRLAFVLVPTFFVTVFKFKVPGGGRLTAASLLTRLTRSVKLVTYTSCSALTPVGTRPGGGRLLVLRQQILNPCS